MQPLEKFSRIIDRKKYDVATAILIASNRYWDGRNMERRGRNMFLYKTSKGAFFLVTRTLWQGERDELIPVEQDEAIRLYEQELSEHEVKFSEAFPGVEVTEA